MSIFEQMVLGRLETLGSHYDFFAATFRHLDQQIKAVKDKLAELHYERDT